MTVIRPVLAILALPAFVLMGCTQRGTIPATGNPDQPVSSDQATPPAAVPADPGPVEVRLAAVDSIDILVMESMPVQVSVVANGNLPDGCTSIGQATTQREKNTFVVTLTTTRPVDAVCTQALVPFEQAIPLDAEGLTAGLYTVSVNGVTGTFELAVDNVLPAEPAPK
jgi:inhibitor of cysteine peptidase